MQIINTLILHMLFDFDFEGKLRMVPHSGCIEQFIC